MSAALMKGKEEGEEGEEVNISEVAAVGNRHLVEGNTRQIIRQEQRRGK